MKFKELGISENIVKTLENRKIVNPTEIQVSSIRDILEGKDVIAEAETGTGKTLAFLLPIFENIKPDSKDIECLIVTPTRELALQITDEALKLKEGKDINVLSMYGGKDIGAQLKKLKGNINIIVATPGRLLDHINRKTVNLKKLKTVVIDEADQMLLMGFKNEIDLVMKEIGKKVQTLCFSATISKTVKKLAYRYMNNPVVISIKKEEVLIDSIKQEVVETTDRLKREDLCKVLDSDNPFMAIIFCRTKRRANELEEFMHKNKYNCKVIHSDIPQNKRERIMKSFRECDIQYLIATDVASRGLDINGVSCIYNYDIPEKPETYIHRIGRTGRAGESGYTCLFATPKDSTLLKEIEDEIKFNIKRRII